MENTNPNGSEHLTVSQAASVFEGLMGSDDEAGNSQSDEEQVEQEEVEEVDEGESTDDDESYEDSEEEEEKPTKQRFKVKAAGEEVEVELDELISGYQQGKDYTKKSQALAEQRKAFEAEQVHLEQVKQERQAYQTKLQALDQFLSQQGGDENLEFLKETDPIGYAVKVAERSEREKQLNVVRAEQQRLAQQQQAERDAQLQKHLSSEAEKLAERIPELAGDKGNAIKSEIREYAKSVGWSDKELASVYDHRAVLTLYKAMKYEQLQKAKPDAMKRVKAAPKTLKSGTSTPPTRSDADKKAMQRLRQTGKVADAAKAFERFF